MICPLALAGMQPSAKNCMTVILVRRDSGPCQARIWLRDAARLELLLEGNSNAIC